MLHGFDVALMSEIVESEALYAREVEGMFRRWRALRPSVETSVADGLESEFGPGEDGDVGGAGPLKLQLAALDSEARELVDFVVWNLVACGKICKKRDKLFGGETPIRQQVSLTLRKRPQWGATQCRTLLVELRDSYAALARCDGDVADRATQGCFNCTSNGVFGDRMCQKKHPRFENLKRDDHSSKNQLKRVETDRDMSLES